MLTLYRLSKLLLPITLFRLYEVIDRVGLEGILVNWYFLRELLTDVVVLGLQWLFSRLDFLLKRCHLNLSIPFNSLFGLTFFLLPFLILVATKPVTFITTIRLIG